MLVIFAFAIIKVRMLMKVIAFYCSTIIANFPLFYAVLPHFGPYMSPTSPALATSARVEVVGEDPYTNSNNF